ncbi:MAG: N-formylglutamate amidohydrolase [Nitrospinota bacterium]
MSKFPVLLSIPHGGTDVPPEISSRVFITAKDQFEDGDALTRQIYGINDSVSACVEGKIARAFVDLNRDVNDRPPENPDGVVKSMTCLGQPIYHKGQELDQEMTDLVLEKYYYPYHDLIRKTLDSNSELQLMLDCHTMEAVGPEISPDPGKTRPKFCLGSNFGKSCPEDIVQKMADCIRKVYKLNQEDVVIDKPFSGGHITRTYGNQPIPCIQIEMSRALYLSSPWFNPKFMTVLPDRLEELREKFFQTLNLFFK